MSSVEKLAATCHHNSTVTKNYRIDVWGKSKFIRFKLMLDKYGEIYLAAVPWKRFQQWMFKESENENFLKEHLLCWKI